MAKPALTVHQGQACPSLSMVVRVAARSEEYWFDAYLLALGDELAVPVGQTEALFQAGEVTTAARAEWMAAGRRLKRAVCEAEGRRWLKAVRP